MRKVQCPVCENTKRPYGIPRTDKPRAIQSHQLEYEIGTYEMKCKHCGTILYVRTDFILELAPVDIREAWASDGTPAEVIDEKRGKGSTLVRTDEQLKRVDETSIPGPVKGE